MTRQRVTTALCQAAAVLFVFAVEPDPMASAQAGAQGSKVPVSSLKTFTSVPEWVLDITWTAKDSFANADFTATMEMTATARFYLKQSDKSDAWGRWHVEKPHTANLSYSALLVNKHDKSRTEYRQSSTEPVDGGANFQVGVGAGYQLDCEMAFPARLTNPLLGPIDTLLTLLTADISGAAPVRLGGLLPAKGTTIHGSAVFPAVVPPFGAEPVPQTRLGIQFVLQEDPLAPLVSPKK